METIIDKKNKDEPKCNTCHFFNLLATKKDVGVCNKDKQVVYVICYVSVPGHPELTREAGLGTVLYQYAKKLTEVNKLCDFYIKRRNSIKR